MCGIVGLASQVPIAQADLLVAMGECGRTAARPARARRLGRQIFGQNTTVEIFNEIIHKGRNPEQGRGAQARLLWFRGEGARAYPLPKRFTRQRSRRAPACRKP